MAVGTATIDFGTDPYGSMTAEVVITGQPDIVPGSLAEAFVMYEDSVDHTATEHMICGLRLYCGDIVPGVGFTIHGLTDFPVNGVFHVKWVWN